MTHRPLAVTADFNVTPVSLSLSPPIMSTGDTDENDDTVHSLNNSLEDLEQHAIELARLATTFDKQDNLKAASYYYQVGREF